MVSAVTTSNAKEPTLQAAAIQPAIAWKINDQFSAGAGLAVL